MARTFSLQSTAYDGRYLIVRCTQEQDVVNNRSIIRWTLASEGGGSTYYSIAPTTVTINGEVVASYGRTSYSSHVFPAAKGSVSGTKYITHNSDGTKSITVKLATNVYVDTYTPVETSGTWTLDAIPQTASITKANNFGSIQNPSFQYSNPLGTAVDALQVALGTDSTSPATAYRDVPKDGFSMGWQLSGTELTALITATSGTSRTVYYFLKTTLNGTDTVVTASATFTVTENAATKPTVSLSAVPINLQLPSAFSGMYIQGKSKLRVVVTAAGQYGATIAERKTVIAGQAYTFTEATFTTDLMLAPGTNTITVTVKDSRGFTNTATTTITVYEYSAPAVIPLAGEDEPRVYRSDNSGTPTNTSDKLWLEAGVSYSSLNGNNSCTLRYRYKLVSAQSWGSWQTLTLTDGEYDALISGTFAITSSYDVEVGVVDTIGEERSIPFTIPTEDIAFDAPKDYKAVGFGKHALQQNYTILMGWDTYFDGDLLVKENNTYVNLVTKLINTIKSQVLEAAYPVGCLYWSADDTNPATVLGFGTWTAIEDTFILAAGSTYQKPTPESFVSQAGAASHTLTVDEMPSHDHAGNDSSYFYGTKGTGSEEINGMQSGSSFSGSGAEAGVKRKQKTAATGGGNSFSIMPPYLVRYCWQRTA